MEEEISGVAKCARILFPRDGKSTGEFTIARFTSNDEDMPRSFSVKGEFYAEAGEEYQIHAVHDEKASKKFPNSFMSITVRKDVNLNKESRESVENFLFSVMTESVAEMLVQLDDPIEALERHDYDTLKSVKGMGQAKAEKAVDVYFSQKDYSVAFTELSKYNFTPKAIHKIVKHFRSPDTAVKRITDNPYSLTEVDGYGFKKADEIFLAGGGKANDVKRVEAYIEYLFEEKESEGHSWITPREFTNQVKKFFPTAPREIYKHAADYVTSLSSEYMYISDDNGKRITTTRMHHIENQIALELKRLLEAKSTMNLDDNIEKSITKANERNGFEYTDEQKQAIYEMKDNNVYMLQGLAGTGKSSVVSGFLNLVSDSGYQYVTTALSGMAADNLTKVTGSQGLTIHSLIGMRPGEEPRFNEKNPLPTNVVVLDEVSMVNSEVFLSLLGAIPTGSKLIMIGDEGQLDPIGVGIMSALIKTKSVPMMLLKNIHRQAKSSAIITHSFALRNGRKPEELNLNLKEETYGELQDLEYTFVNDSFEHELLDKGIDKFKLALQKYDIRDIQILCSTKKTGVVSTFELNQKAQEIYNPLTSDNIGIELGYGDYKYQLRVGDKVVNMKNNRDTQATDNKIKPIYNGNTGIVVDVQEDSEDDHKIIVDFDGIGEVVVEGDHLKYIQLGYAITIHKSQGSTIKSVIFVMPYHYMLNSRELAYTAMTRASEELYFLTSSRSYKRAVKTTHSKSKQVNLEYLLPEHELGEVA